VPAHTAAHAPPLVGDRPGNRAGEPLYGVAVAALLDARRVRTVTSVTRPVTARPARNSWTGRTSRSAGTNRGARTGTGVAAGPPVPAVTRAAWAVPAARVCLAPAVLPVMRGALTVTTAARAATAARVQRLHLPGLVVGVD
jgi:hypothetical protein